MFTLLVLLEFSVLFKVREPHNSTSIRTIILIRDFLGNFPMLVFLAHDSRFLKLPYLILIFLLERFLAGNCRLIFATK